MDKFVYCAVSSPLEPEEPRLIQWIEDSLNRGVRELSVTKYTHGTQMLPQNILNYKNLTVLKLHGLFDLYVQDDVCLQNLKTLDLKHVRFVGDESIGRLFQSCTVLEDLSLNNCVPKDLEIYYICVPTLLRLKIHEIRDLYVFVLYVPNLTYFEYHGCELLGFYFKCGLESLVDASISFPNVIFSWFDTGSKLVSLVSHLQTLHFCAYTLDAYQRFGQPFPTFPNVTTLEMTFHGSADFDFDMGLFANLLDRTPRLDRLVLVDNVYNDTDGPSNTLELERVPICVSTHLKVIEFKDFWMMDYERNLVEYFLKTAKVLNKLHIQWGCRLENQFRFSKEVLAFSRCSRACQVSISSGEK